jgi:hypothetical protein
MTSIEWLEKKLKGDEIFSLETILSKAKEMHKKEIIDAANLAKDNWFDVINYNSLGEQYYQETFVSKVSGDTSSQTDENGKPITYWGGLKDRTCTNSCSVVCGECQIFNISDDCEEVRNWDSFVEQKNKELNDQVPDVRKMVEDDAAPIDWLINQLENHIVLSAHNKIGTNRTGDYRIGLRKAIDFCHQAKEMKAKETLYTEEQVREAMDFARGHNKMTDTQFIQSLKQPKQ